MRRRARCRRPGGMEPRVLHRAACFSSNSAPQELKNYTSIYNITPQLNKNNNCKNVVTYSLWILTIQLRRASASAFSDLDRGHFMMSSLVRPAAKMFQQVLANLWNTCCTHVSWMMIQPPQVPTWKNGPNVFLQSTLGSISWVLENVDGHLEQILWLKRTQWDPEPSE